MDVPRFKLACLFLALVLVCGCTRPGGPWSLSRLPDDVVPQGTPRTEGSQVPTDRMTAAVAPEDRRAGSKIAPPEAVATAARSEVDPSEMTNLIAELQTLGAIDPAVQSRLMDDLKRTDPALWPALMQSFRATLAYQRKQQGAPDDINLSEAQSHAAAAPPAQQPAAMTPPHPLSAPPLVSSPAVAAVQEPPPSNTSSAEPLAPAQPVQLTELTASEVGPTEVQAVHQTPAPPLAPNPANWRQDLGTAIAALEQDQRYPLDSPEEAARQARLRLLYLVAGRRDDALRPVAGLDSHQQDFWSKELYGLSIYLDTNQTPDVAKRATEAALYLGQATTSLSSVSDLVLKNLAFCTEVKKLWRVRNLSDHRVQAQAGDAALCRGRKLRQPIVFRGLSHGAEKQLRNLRYPRPSSRRT